MARAARRKIIEKNIQALPMSPHDQVFTKEEKIELLTRNIVHDYNTEGKERIIGNVELERVIFDILYPLFGSRQKGAGKGKGVEGMEGDSSCLLQ